MHSKKVYSIAEKCGQYVNIAGQEHVFAALLGARLICVSRERWTAGGCLRIHISDKVYVSALDWWTSTNK